MVVDMITIAAPSEVFATSRNRLNAKSLLPLTNCRSVRVRLIYFSSLFSTRRTGSSCSVESSELHPIAAAIIRAIATHILYSFIIPAYLIYFYENKHEKTKILHEKVLNLYACSQNPPLQNKTIRVSKKESQILRKKQTR